MEARTAASDFDLVEQAARNDQAAYGALYERHLAALYDYARRLMRDADEAADVVQVAFIKAFEAIRRTGAAPRTFRPWLFQIAHNEAFDRLRRSRFVEPESEEALIQLPDSSDEATPAELAERRETAELVWRAVRGLRPDEQELLLLSMREGLDAGEIAQVIGKKRETVHVALSRVRDAFEDVFTTLALLTQGTRGCAELAAISAGADLSPKLRRQVRRHVDECETCAEKRRRCVQEMAVFGVLAPVQVPTEVKAALWRQISDRLSAPPSSGPPGPWQATALRVGDRPWWTLLGIAAISVVILGLATRSATSRVAAADVVAIATPTASPLVLAIATPSAAPATPTATLEQSPLQPTHTARPEVAPAPSDPPQTPMVPSPTIVQVAPPQDAPSRTPPPSPKSVPPTPTPPLPTVMPLPPTDTPLSATPLTATPLSPTPTSSREPPTPMPNVTAIPLPPTPARTATRVPPTPTPTATAIPPPPTLTPTATRVPPTRTPTPTPTPTLPPRATVTPTPTPRVPGLR